MTGEQFELAKRAFVDALQAAEPERSRVVSEICGGDEEAQAEAERLLSLSLGAQNFLGQPAVEQLDLGEVVDLASGTLLHGRYRIQQLLTHGGFSTVYRAHDERLLDRAVVVKVLRKGEATSDAFKHELAALAPLEHENVVPIYDTGILDDGRPYLVMKFIGGPTLRDVIAEVPLLYSRFRLILLQILSALDTAHALDIFHLDLKPENIVLENAGTTQERAIVIDFGIASIGGRLMGQGAGSTYYMSPEQAAGKAQAASDYYALARLCFELLTGSIPAECPDVELSRRRPEIPGRVRRYLLDALSEQPSARIQAFERLRADYNRKSPARGAIGAAIAAGLLLTFLLARQDRPKSLQLSLDTIQPFTTDPGHERFPRFSPDGTLVYYAASLDGGKPADILFRPVSGGPAQPLTRTPDREERPIASPDGKSIAFLRTYENRTMAVISLELATRREQVVAQGDFHSLDWHPDGDFILVAGRPTGASRHALYWLNARTGFERLLLDSPPESRDTDPRISPDGRRVVFIRELPQYGEDILVLPLTARRDAAGQPRRLDAAFVSARNPVFSPSGDTIIYAAGVPGLLSLWSAPADGSTAATRLSAAADPVDHFDVAPVTNRMVFARDEEDSNVWRAPLLQGKALNPELVTGSTWRDERAALSPKGDRLVFISTRSGSEQMWVSKPDGSEPRQLTAAHGSAVNAALWTPDGTRIVLCRLEQGESVSYFVDPSDGKLELLDREVAKGGVRGLSRSGKDTFFTSTRDGGAYQLFRRPLTGGTWSRLTRDGGYEVEESFDGTGIYFTRRTDHEGLWWMAYAGGAPMQLSPQVTRRAFSVVPGGVYFEHGDRILRYDTRTQRQTEVLRPGRPLSFGLSVSKDETWIYYSVFDRQGTDLMLVENLERR